MNNTHGKHIKWRIVGSPFDRLIDQKLVALLLDESVKAAGMRSLGAPQVYDIGDELRKMGLEPDENEPEGITGFVVLSTSHAIVHTWPHRGYAIMDLYSCCDFEQHKVAAVIQHRLRPKRMTFDDLSFCLSPDTEELQDVPAIE